MLAGEIFNDHRTESAFHGANVFGRLFQGREIFLIRFKLTHCDLLCQTGEERLDLYRKIK